MYKIANIIGIILILIITITPTTPIAFFKITPHPNTLSTTSPKTFPTTGITLDTIDFAVFAVIPSTLLLNVPSNDTIPTNIVNKTPRNHTTPDFKNFDILSTCTLSEILDIIENTTIINTIGISASAIIFPIKLQINKMPSWNINKYSLDGSDSSGYTYSFGKQELYVMEPKVDTIVEGKRRIDLIIEGKKLKRSK